ncbi:MAG: type II toxin-antitoxin system RelB/DinJ family antitoxin [Cardiobacteriaceae bacterium]|nr:type II toxin-antitoxin system RelB/DinJ family antitoxin [Cardiobacteriaceae bacterium]
MPSITFSIRLDSELKKQSFEMIESYGLTPAQAIKMFLTQIVQTQSIPLSLNYQNPQAEETANSQNSEENSLATEAQNQFDN